MKSKRSKEQSAYRWAVVVPAIRNHWKKHGFNYTPDQVNFMMKLAAGRYVEIVEMPWGERIKRELPTNTGTVQEFEYWMDDVRAWAYDRFDLDIATPNAIPIEEYE